MKPVRCDCGYEIRRLFGRIPKPAVRPDAIPYFGLMTRCPECDERVMLAEGIGWNRYLLMLGLHAEFFARQERRAS